MGDVVSRWALDPGGLVLAATLAAGYATGVRRLAGRGRRWPPGRAAAAVGAVAAIVVATQSGLARLEEERFTAHMGQHVVLGMVAPALLALSAPVTLAVQAVGRPTRRALLRLLHGRTARALSHPVTVWLLFGGTLFVLYLTPLLRLSLEHPVVHVAVHLHFLAAGWLFCWTALAVDPVPRRLPHGARLAFVLLAVPVHAVAGLAMLTAGEPLAPGWYDVADQRTAAGMLWVTGDLFGVLLAGGVLARWMAADERAAARFDRAALSPLPTAGDIGNSADDP